MTNKELASVLETTRSRITTFLASCMYEAAKRLAHSVDRKEYARVVAERDDLIAQSERWETVAVIGATALGKRSAKKVEDLRKDS